jgi:hypothetical protein
LETNPAQPGRLAAIGGPISREFQCASSSSPEGADFVEVRTAIIIVGAHPARERRRPC